MTEEAHGGVVAPGVERHRLPGVTGGPQSFRNPVPLADGRDELRQEWDLDPHLAPIGGRPILLTVEEAGSEAVHHPDPTVLGAAQVAAGDRSRHLRSGCQGQFPTALGAPQ